MSRRRVVVTGLGIVCPVGNSVKEAWSNILAGKSGITRITRFDAVPFASQIAGEVKNFDVGRVLSPKEARRVDTFIHYGVAAAVEAIKDAGLEANPKDAERIGVNIGSGIGGLPMIEETHKTLLESGPRKISPFFIPGAIINMISGNLSIMYGFKGPCLAMVTACTTANHCIGDSARLIEYGDADVMVAGGSEACICPLGIGGFSAARALSTRNDDPATASRPWDTERDGFVLGEGAGVLVLEELEHAKARGASIYCELAGYGMSADAHHITAPCEDGEGAARGMINAMRNGGDQSGRRGLHQCAWHLDAARRSRGNNRGQTLLRRPREKTGGQFHQVRDRTSAGRRGRRRGGVLGHGNAGPDRPADHQPVQAGSASAISITCPTRRAQMKIKVVMSNSFGFGGTNGTLIFRAT